MEDSGRKNDAAAAIARSDRIVVTEDEILIPSIGRIAKSDLRDAWIQSRLGRPRVMIDVMRKIADDDTQQAHLRVAAAIALSADDDDDEKRIAALAALDRGDS